MRIRFNLSISWSGLLLALVCSSPLSSFPQNQVGSSSAPAALMPYGRCAAPSQQGVAICMPYQGAEVPAPFQFIGSGTSGRGQVASMQLWADGRKIVQKPGTPFDEPITLPIGDHQLTLVEVDETGSYSNSTPLKLTVVESNAPHGPCLPPDTPGVNICQPTPNGCNTQPWINVSAAGRGATGPVIRMEMWVSGAKVANFPGDHIETNMILFDSNYTIEIWEIDTHSHALKSSLHFFGPC